MLRATELPVVIALGNRYRGDDGVGHFIAEELAHRNAKCRLIANQDDSMGLLNAWQDTTLAIVVDAAISGATAGTIHRLDAVDNPLPKDLARCSSHGVGLAEAIELGMVMDKLPPRLLVYAIEAERFESGQLLSPAVQSSVAIVVKEIEVELTREIHA